MFPENWNIATDLDCLDKAHLLFIPSTTDSTQGRDVFWISFLLKKNLERTIVLASPGW